MAKHPLIALQYHEVKVILEHQLKAAFTSVTSADLYCNYIYLDTDERRRFAQVSHEYLIEQVQKQSATASTTSKLNFNHPVKELVFGTDAYTNNVSHGGIGSGLFMNPSFRNHIQFAQPR